MPPDQPNVTCAPIFCGVPLGDEVANSWAIGHLALKEVPSLHALCDPISQISVHPIQQRRLEPNLECTCANLLRQYSPHSFAQDSLAVTAARLTLVGKREGKSYEPPIEERHAHLDAVRHGHAIVFPQQRLIDPV